MTAPQPEEPSFLLRLLAETLARGPNDAPGLRLEATSGPLAGRSFDVSGQSSVVVGRDRDCHLFLPTDTSLSRHHCVIELAPPHVRVRDLGSSNGTSVNGARIETLDLSPGDEVRIGVTTLRLVLDGAPAPVSEAPAEAVGPGESFPGYKLLGKLGEGGQGVVYSARDTTTGQVVALKTLRPALRQDAEAVKTFLREAENGLKVAHPHAVTFLGSGFSRGFFYFVMELLEGPSLAGHVVERGGRLPAAELLPVIDQVTQVLEFAHARGLVHRDVKLENIIVARKSPSLTVKLADFGLMRSFERSGHSFAITRTGTGKGTVLHMPPEQVMDAKRVGPRSDIYSFASTVFLALTGEPALPFREDHSPIRTLFEERPRLLRSLRPELPQSAEAVLDRALDKDPGRRQGSMRELGQELIAALAGS